MKVLVNALSVTNASGRHVLQGHLGRLVQWTAGQHEYAILYHANNEDMRHVLGEDLQWIRCPDSTVGWLGRTLWENSAFRTVIIRSGADMVFTPAGTATPGLNVPQVSFAQNPWCLVPGLQRSIFGRCKAAMQRYAYRLAMQQARMMIFNSEYMRSIYRENAGFTEKDSEVVYQGVDDETFQAASVLKGVERRPLRVASVSAMAPHKGVETLVQAVYHVRRDSGVGVELELVGAWPDKPYETRIRKLIAALGLDDAVRIRGHVSQEELDMAYAQARVFCLMSHCESFGIPAVEAQAFGTPVVSSNCCAIPEVCGEGGVFPEAGDVEAVARELFRLITDDAHWCFLSEKARSNAQRFRWDECSKKLLRMFEVVA